MAHPTAAQGFRDRLERVIAQAGLNQAGFARHVGIDRSTLSQLLSSDNDRLPRAETLVAIARGCRISIDWLLGLSQREQVGAELVEAVLTIETQAHAPFDERFPARPGRLCSWCDFARHCPEGREAAPRKDPWAALPDES